MPSPFDPIVNYILPQMRRQYSGFPFDKDFVIAVLTGVVKEYKNILKANNYSTDTPGVIASDFTRYICGYHFSFVCSMGEMDIRKLEADPNYRKMLIEKISKSIFLLEKNNLTISKIVDEHQPIYCDFNILLDYLLFVLLRAWNLLRDTPEFTVLKMFESAILKTKGVVTLLSKGLELDGLVVWRSLHEMECVLKILCTYGQPLITLYNRFDKFDKSSKNMSPEVLEEYNERTKALGINMHNPNEVDHFENYGWLTGIPNMEITKRNLNFKFVEDLAGLGLRYRDYQYASDALHMNTKILKWNRLDIVEHVVLCCFNTIDSILVSLKEFLSNMNLNFLDENLATSYRDALQLSIATFKKFLFARRI